MEDMKEKEFPFLNEITPDFIRFPPNSNPPVGFNHIQKIKNEFSSKGASMLPKLQDFNQLFRQKADSLVNMNSSIIPPGHPLFSRENSIITLKEENDKLLKENLENTLIT
mgnify:FL=1